MEVSGCPDVEVEPGEIWRSVGVHREVEPGGQWVSRCRSRTRRDMEVSGCPDVDTCIEK